MASIAIIDIIGLTYDGTTLSKRGLGGSESAVILISKELQKQGFDVTVFNNCIDDDSSEGIYDGVKYIDLLRLKDKRDYNFDIVISSRTVIPFVAEKHWATFGQDIVNHRYPHPSLFKHIKDNAKLKIVWMHDTFCRGDHLIEEMLLEGDIDELFTLSDFHTSYVTNCDHGRKRNFEVLKNKIFLTRNGIQKHKNYVDISQKDPDLFVYNSSVTKGMVPLVENIWEKIKQNIPTAKLKIIGGFYRFRNNEPDDQERKWRQMIAEPKYKNLDIEFTGIIRQDEIAEILSKASFMIYPPAFPETFGISSLEALYYNTPLITSRFGALEETAVETACWLMDYPIEPNSLFPFINSEEQERKFIDLVFRAHSDKYLHQQKMYYCNTIKEFCGWDSVALQWKQHLVRKIGEYLPVDDFRKISYINDRVHQIFGRRFSNKEEWNTFKTIEQPISIVSTFYNCEKYIQKCIDSVISQDYENYKLYLIDDCSNDKTVDIVKAKLSSFAPKTRDKIVFITNSENKGAVRNQIETIKNYIDNEDIVILLDGDDSFVNDNNILNYYNNLYQNEQTEFAYGSCWSMCDNIPLVSQPYPEEVKRSRAYRNHRFNWILPYTHTRTFKAKLAKNVHDSNFKDVNGEWYKAGGDGAVFYSVIEQADPEKIKVVQDIFYNYNDTNLLNDYKVNPELQNKNAREISNRTSSLNLFTVIIPTMWRCQEIFYKGLNNYISNPLINDIIIINNDVNKTPNWDILKHEKIRVIDQKQNIYVNKAFNIGVELSKNEKLCFANDDIVFDMRLMDKLYNRIIPENGAHGIITGEAKFGHPPTTDGAINFLEWRPGYIIHGFGQIMIMHKKNWIPIIDELNLYFGDDYIFHMNLMKGVKNYLIYNIFHEALMAQTTKDPAISEGMYEKEKPHWEKWFFENPLPSVKEEVKQIAPIKEKKKILIAIPTAKYIEPETFKSIYDLEVPEEYETTFQFFYGYNIAQIRNLIAHWAERYDYLFSVDSDIVFEKDTLKKLLSHDKDVVSGLYIQRKEEKVLEIYRINKRGGVSNVTYEDLSKESLARISACGFGCVLIKSQVIRRIGYPQFIYREALDHKHTVSEDVHFCARAIEEGFDIWADTTILCEHIGNKKYKVIG